MSWTARARCSYKLLRRAVASEVARRHGLMPQQVFTWRRQARSPSMTKAEAPLFVPVVVDAVATAPAVCKERKASPRYKPKPDAGIIETRLRALRSGLAAGRTPT